MSPALNTVVTPNIIDIRHVSLPRNCCGSITSESENGSDFDRKNAVETSSEGGESLDESDEEQFKFHLADSIKKGLTPPKGQPKSIPTVVLYDDKGLQIYDEITYLEEYYLVQEEIDILVSDSDKIVDFIPDNSVVVELGSGSLRKTRVLLDALERKRKNIHYYALDLMRDELTKSLASLLGRYENVEASGLWGTYDEGMDFISSFPSDIPKTILWLGSSIGNFTRTEAAQFITSYRDHLNIGDNWLIGIDRRNAASDITLAYNDPTRVIREFIINGLDHVNRILEQPLLERDKFEYFGQYNDELGRHEAFYQSLQDQELVLKEKDGTLTNIKLEKNELILVANSYKWSLQESTQLFQKTKMTKIGQWESPRKRYDLHMLRKAPFYFKTNLTKEKMEFGMPTIEDWEELWKAWNMVTMEMIRHPEMVLEKPIGLRHPFIFYIGHIPGFLDIQLSKLLNEPYTKPSLFPKIFERGVDPDVDEPSSCHEHSVVPETWPEVDDLIQYRDEVYSRLMRIIGDSGTYPRTRRFCRILFMVFEHQAMHLETILYMLVQSKLTLPPKGFDSPISLDSSSTEITPPLPAASWIHIDPKSCDADILCLGHNDVKSHDFTKPLGTNTELGWDIEDPQVTPVPFDSFSIQSRQVTNAEYLEFIKDKSNQRIGEAELPKSWVYSTQTSSLYVRSVFGLVPMEIGKNWAVACSQKEALSYISWLDPMGETYALPTEEQLSLAFKLKKSSENGLRNCNYGFKAWYPISKLREHPETKADWAEFHGPGGLWDWTSTIFAPLSPDFEKSEIYPGYSSDFFDGKHYVVLGGSWATHPRIAERQSFRNWYQAKYEYAFTGFRLVRKA